MVPLTPNDTPFCTDWLPGVGGLLKGEPADFVVDEVDAYPPAGNGDHLFLRIEKQGVSAADLVAHLASVLRIRPSEVGVAGQKDARAVTRQTVSVPATAASHVAAIDTPRIRVLSQALHPHKLRLGHLKGNRFEIRVRDVHPDADARARDVATALRASGLPNFYGPQRFGRAGDTHLLGLRLLQGLSVPHGRGLRRLAISALQAALFNDYLRARMADGFLHTVLPGDVLKVVASGGPFVTDDPAREQARFEAREVVPAGPMLGPKMKATELTAGAREAHLWQRWQIDPASFGQLGKLALGTRRANLVWLTDLEVHASGGTLETRFFLPPGSYATVVLRELMK